jgi:hypothetical protein
MERNAVEEAIQAVGGPTKASYVCQVSVGAIWKWRQNKRVSDGRAAVLLADASGVPVEALVGLVVLNGTGDEPPQGGKFRKGGRVITTTYPVLNPSLPDPLPPVAASLAA